MLVNKLETFNKILLNSAGGINKMRTLLVHSGVL